MGTPLSADAYTRPDYTCSGELPRLEDMRKFLVTASLVTAVGIGIRHLAATWASTSDERRRTLPGDEFVGLPHAQADRAVTISAPPERVWPWLMQLGQDRGGFYSFEAIENLMGCQIEGVSTIREEWATREPSDRVHLAPEVALRVAIADAPRALVLRGDKHADGLQDADGLPEQFTWAFVLTGADGGTRLHVRERYRFSRRREQLLSHLVLVVSGIMTVKMLDGIRRLATGSSTP